MNQSRTTKALKIKNFYSKEIITILSSFFLGVTISSIPFFIELNKINKQNKINKLVIESKRKDKESKCKDSNQTSYSKLLDQGFTSSAQKVLDECMNKI